MRTHVDALRSAGAPPLPQIFYGELNTEHVKKIPDKIAALVGLHTLRCVLPPSAGLDTRPHSGGSAV